MKPAITFITTGGTIDKVSFDSKSEHEVGPPQVADILRDGNVAFDHGIVPVLAKDSLELTDADRALIRERVASADTPWVVVTPANLRKNRERQRFEEVA